MTRATRRAGVGGAGRVDAAEGGGRVFRAVECSPPEKLVMACKRPHWCEPRTYESPRSRGTSSSAAHTEQTCGPRRRSLVERSTRRAGRHVGAAGFLGARLLAPNVPVAGVVVPWRGRDGARLLDKELVVQYVRCA